MLHKGLKKLAHIFGPETDLAWVRWVPTSDDTQTLLEAHGVRSVARTGSLASIIALANELRADFTAHLTQGVHVVADTENVVATANASNEGTAITLANALQAAYNLHLVETGVHVNDDDQNEDATAVAEDEATLVALVNALKAAYNLHLEEATVHAIDDTVNDVATADATNTATAITLANALKAAFNLHLGQKVHAADDETNVLTTPAATNMATALALLNEIRTQYTAHIADDTAHANADETNVLTEPAATTRATAMALANEIKDALNAHYEEATVHELDDTANEVTTADVAAAGSYQINLRQKGGVLFPLVGYIENDTSHFHFLDVVSSDPDESSVDVRHRRVAYASVASGPTADDTVDGIVALIFQPRSNTIRCGAKHRLKSFGPRTEWAYARWAPSGSATQTLTEAHGVKRIARSGAGAWTVTLDSACEAMLVLIAYVENDTTHYHFAEVTATNAAAGTFTARHRSVAYASVASGPSASDTVDQIEVLVLKRMAT